MGEEKKQAFLQCDLKLGLIQIRGFGIRHELNSGFVNDEIKGGNT